MLKTKTISVTINREPERVMEYVLHAKNLPLWAKAFCKSIRNVNGEWIMETPRGQMKVRFVEKNAFGILDHDIIPPKESPFRVPMRVVPNQNGSEVMLTLFQFAGMPDHVFAEDQKLVTRDLQTLKDVLER
jgi:hypothetical protein